MRCLVVVCSCLRRTRERRGWHLAVGSRRDSRGHHECASRSGRGRPASPRASFRRCANQSLSAKAAKPEPRRQHQETLNSPPQTACHDRPERGRRRASESSTAYRNAWSDATLSDKHRVQQRLRASPIARLGTGVQNLIPEAGEPSHGLKPSGRTGHADLSQHRASWERRLQSATPGNADLCQPNPGTPSSVGTRPSRHPPASTPIVPPAAEPKHPPRPRRRYRDQNRPPTKASPSHKPRANGIGRCPLPAYTTRTPAPRRRGPQPNPASEQPP